MFYCAHYDIIITRFYNKLYWCIIRVLTVDLCGGRDTVTSCMHVFVLYMHVTKLQTPKQNPRFGFNPGTQRREKSLPHPHIFVPEPRATRYSPTPFHHQPGAATRPTPTPKHLLLIGRSHTHTSARIHRHGNVSLAVVARIFFILKLYFIETIKNYIMPVSK